MSKKDIGFIKHIKPQLKERAQRDKDTSKQIRYQKACENQVKVGINPYPSDNLEIVAMVANALKSCENEQGGGSG